MGVTFKAARRPVDLTDMSRSYPFLDLSRRLSVSYPTVLEIADWVDAWNATALGPPTAPMVQHRFDIPEDKYLAIRDVCRAPWRWQFPPEGRGL